MTRNIIQLQSKLYRNKKSRNTIYIIESQDERLYNSRYILEIERVCTLIYKNQQTIYIFWYITSINYNEIDKFVNNLQYSRRKNSRKININSRDQK